MFKNWKFPPPWCSCLPLQDVLTGSSNGCFLWLEANLPSKVMAHPEIMELIEPCRLTQVGRNGLDWPCVQPGGGALGGKELCFSRNITLHHSSPLSFIAAAATLREICGLGFLPEKGFISCFKCQDPVGCPPAPSYLTWVCSRPLLTSV